MRDVQRSLNSITFSGFYLSVFKRIKRHSRNEKNKASWNMDGEDR